MTQQNLGSNTMRQEKRRFAPPTTISENTEYLHYLLYKPEGNPSSGKPLLVFLHGMGERGDTLDDLDMLLMYGPPMMIEQGWDFDAIVASPQCPTDTFWPALITELDAWLDALVAEHEVDGSRIYLTGLSMGGFGAVHWALARSERFAALAPICGGYSFTGDDVPEEVQKLKGVPFWAFHGEMDDTVPASRSQVLVETLQACGAEPRYTEYAGVGHDSWTNAYVEEEFWDWLFRQRKEG